jgi:hypothetical protein
MKKRYVYILLFGIPGLFVAGIISIFVFAAFTGILWLYVFGDNPWPDSGETLISVLFVVVFGVLWVGLIALGYLVGKNLETEPLVNSVGNLGPKSDSVLCSKFCTQHGYSGSGMPPQNSGDRTCSCYDRSGSEALRIPLDYIAPDGSR